MLSDEKDLLEGMLIDFENEYNEKIIRYKTLKEKNINLSNQSKELGKVLAKKDLELANYESRLESMQANIDTIRTEVADAFDLIKQSYLAEKNDSYDSIKGFFSKVKSKVKITAKNLQKEVEQAINDLKNPLNDSNDNQPYL